MRRETLFISSAVSYVNPPSDWRHLLLFNRPNMNLEQLSLEKYVNMLSNRSNYKAYLTSEALHVFDGQLV